MLAKNGNDNACVLTERGACEFFASKLAPTKSFLTASHFNRLESLARRLHGQFVPAFSFLEYCL